MFTGHTIRQMNVCVKMLFTGGYSSSMDETCRGVIDELHDLQVKEMGDMQALLRPSEPLPNAVGVLEVVRSSLTAAEASRTIMQWIG